MYATVPYSRTHWTARPSPTTGTTTARRPFSRRRQEVTRYPPDNENAGSPIQSIQATELKLLAVAAFLAIPACMIFVSSILFKFIVVIEIIVMLLIIRTAWRWPKQDVRSRWSRGENPADRGARAIPDLRGFPLGRHGCELDHGAAEKHG